MGMAEHCRNPTKTRSRAAVGPFLGLVRILNVTLHSKIFPEPMQRDRVHTRGFADSRETWAAGKRDRAGAG